MTDAVIRVYDEAGNLIETHEHKGETEAKIDCHLRLPEPRLSFLSGGVDSRMSSEQITVVLKRFESPDEVRALQKGRFELAHIGGMTIGRATYEPGWKWSEHVGPSIGATRCHVEHIRLVLSGTATAAFDDGTIFKLRAGELFYIPPIPHDSWVIGDQERATLVNKCSPALHPPLALGTLLQQPSVHRARRSE
jgi:mannose-6-phosphate isomerase-like protein (cupin superfamily)